VNTNWEEGERLQFRERALQDKENKYSALINEQTQILEKLSGITTEEAKQEILRRTEENAKFEVAKLIKRIEDEAKENAEKKAKEIIGVQYSVMRVIMSQMLRYLR